MRNLDALPRKGNLIEFPARTGVRFPGPAQHAAHDPWQALTRSLILAKASRGELDPAILAALLDHAGVTP